MTSSALFQTRFSKLNGTSSTCGRDPQHQQKLHKTPSCPASGAFQWSGLGKPEAPTSQAPDSSSKMSSKMPMAMA